MSSRLRVGIAVGVDCVAAEWVAHGNAVTWSASLAHDGRIPPPADVLRSAFADLQTRLPTGCVSLAIAILPPLARLRRIDMPRMKDEDCRLAVTRSAERHFVGLGESAICAVRRRRPENSIVPFVVAAVSAAFINDLECVVAALSWRIDRVVPAHAAWLAAAKQQSRELRRGDGGVIVTGTIETTVLMIRGGALCVARRFRSGEALPDDATLPGSIIIGEDAHSVHSVAARAARFTRSFELIPDTVRRKRRETQRRVANALLVIAAASLVAAGGVYRWGLSHRLDVTEKQRAAIHSGVGRAMAARDTLDRLTRSMRAMQLLDRSSTRWSVAIAQMAVALPRDASLISLRADGDSVVLEGQAANGASVFAALRSAPGVAGVRATSPIRQELAADQTAIERWTLALHVTRSAAARRESK